MVHGASQIIHIIFSWTAIISWMLFVVDLGLIGLLTFRAYKDGNLVTRLTLLRRVAHMLTVAAADTLDRFEVPFFGKLASQILDDE